MSNRKNTLITGGVGFFGKAYIEVLLENYKPGRIIIYPRDELKQFETASVFNALCVCYFIGDVGDKERLSVAMRGVDFVIYAAAVERVPIAGYDPMECIKANVHGTQNVIDACFENGVKKCITLSTDKACNPVNLYGAIKLTSDKLFVAVNNIAGNKQTCFGIIRYGSVVGPEGSVVPFFKKLTEQGAKELPITDTRMARFWISPEDEVKFVLSNFARIHGGKIFIPKVPSMKITDLAHALVPHLSHKIIGIRTGEKLHEIMISSDGSYPAYEFENYYTINPSIKLVNQESDLSINTLDEREQKVKDGFSYSLGNSPLWAGEKELSKIINRIEGF